MSERLVWAQHKISGVVVELEERHLGGPLGHMYKVVPEGTKSEVLAHPTTEEDIAKREAAEKRKLTLAEKNAEEQVDKNVEDAEEQLDASVEAAEEAKEEKAGK